MHKIVTLVVLVSVIPLSQRVFKKEEFIMKKQKLYNVTYLKNKTKVETIKLTESFMWELLECYEGKELDKKNQDIIIKYILPDKNKEEEVSSKALDELMEGIEIKGKRIYSNYRHISILQQKWVPHISDCFQTAP